LLELALLELAPREPAEAWDGVLLAGGATLPRDLPVPGRELSGIHLAMDYLKPSNLVQEGLLESSPISAEGKHVVIIGGGDTGADCLGTVHRQLGRSGVLRLSKHLAGKQMTKVEDSGRFTVTVHVPEAPHACQRFEVQQLQVAQSSEARVTWAEAN